MPEAVPIFNRLYTAGTKTGMFFYKNTMSFDLMDRVQKSVAPKLLENRYNLEHDVLLFPQRHFFFEVFDRKIQQLLEAHLIDHNLKNDNDEGNLKQFDKHEQPFKVLTLDELEAGFVISIAPLALSLVAFCLEWLVTIKDLFVFFITFKTYFRMKKHEQYQQTELNKIKMAAWKLILKEEQSKNVLGKKEVTRYGKSRDWS